MKLCQSGTGYSGDAISPPIIIIYGTALSGGDKLSASTVKVLLERAPDTSFGICIVGGQVTKSINY